LFVNGVDWIMIVLNVGGVYFTTSYETLNMQESFFSGMIRSNSHNFFFIDRDPTHFRHILNALRGSPSYPDTDAGLHELANEAEYYAMFEFKKDILSKQKVMNTSSITNIMSQMLHRMHSMN